ncbi:MAG TPA: glycosyltransferase [Dehalococcoidia bacterium]|nr:glycosyltransferase [Dehalococcoidia bacterium]
MKIAIVHDWLNQIGGAELVLEVLHELFPEAPIYTSMYDPDLMPPAYRGWDIRTTFMQRLPGVTRRHQAFLPVYPIAFGGLDLSAYDLVLSNTSGFGHIVRPRPDAVHINYCLTPPRFLYQPDAYLARERVPAAGRLALRPFIVALRCVDRTARWRVTRFVGISRAVVDRIRRVYDRPADLIYPPVRTDRFPPGRGAGEYFLIVSRLIPYKRVDLAVRAFTTLGKPLVIVGDGRDRATLEALAGPTVRFLGRVPDTDLADLVGNCRAFVFPGEEDFGIAPIEAQAAGRPVIAFAGGGALETVIEGQTGRFFDRPDPESLIGAVERLEADRYDPAAIRAHARAFDIAVFRDRITRLVAEARVGHARDHAFLPTA